MTPAGEWKEMYLDSESKLQRVLGQLQDLQIRYDKEVLKNLELKLINEELYEKARNY